MVGAAGGHTEQQMEEAVEAAVAAANAESEDTLTDLLACLGQEEQKTERCSFSSLPPNGCMLSS